jgi:hypothetical protein
MLLKAVENIFQIYTLLLLLAKRSIFDNRYNGIALIIIAIVSETLGGGGALTIDGTLLSEVFIRNREEGYHEHQDK